jgi:hypothetical protein
VTFFAIPITPLKIVSTPLSCDLIYHTGTFKTGMVTLDQTKRVLPLLNDDPMVMRYPMIGVWIAGVKELSNALVWSALVKYMQCLKIKQRVSPCDNTFLLIAFGTKPVFYEISVSNAEWDTFNFEVECEYNAKSVLISMDDER